MERRSFLKKAGMAALGAAAVNAMGCGGKKETQMEKTGTTSVMISQIPIEWKMVTTWPAGLPVLQTGAERFAQKVEAASEGRLKIKVFSSGELVPALGVFDAVSDGTAECGSSSAYYWAGKIPAAQWFSAVPFGFNAQAMNAWIYSGGGLRLWEDIYAPFNVIPRPIGNSGVQMGGWFREEIKSIHDFIGLKMRIPGLGGKVIAQAGGTVILLPGDEIYAALKNGVIDATEWVGPMHDLKMGFYNVAKYYHYPGWHEPGTCLEVIFNKRAYEALPKDLQLILDAMAMETNLWSLSEFEAGNGIALEELISKRYVEVRPFPKKVLKDLRALAQETLEQEADRDPISRKVHEAYKKFKQQIGMWGSVSEHAYYTELADKYGLKKP